VAAAIIFFFFFSRKEKENRGTFGFLFFCFSSKANSVGGQKTTR
jgi:hypothetical protein